MSSSSPRQHAYQPLQIASRRSGDNTSGEFGVSPRSIYGSSNGDEYEEERGGLGGSDRRFIRSQTGSAFETHQRQAVASQFQRMVSEVGLHDLFRNICVDILVQRPDNAFQFTVKRLQDEVKRRSTPRPPAEGNSRPRRTARLKPKQASVSPRVERLRAKNRQGCVEPKTLIENFKERYRFTCEEARNIFDSLGGQRSRQKTTNLKKFVKAVRANSSYTDGRMDYSSAERLYELFLWAQPAHPKSTINVCEACSVLAALSHETGIERLSTIMYFVAPGQGLSREDRWCNEGWIQ